jgi:hypothetical protein
MLLDRAGLAVATGPAQASPLPAATVAVTGLLCEPPPPPSLPPPTSLGSPGPLPSPAAGASLSSRALAGAASAGRPSRSVEAGGEGQPAGAGLNQSLRGGARGGAAGSLNSSLRRELNRELNSSLRSVASAAPEATAAGSAAGEQRGASRGLAPFAGAIDAATCIPEVAAAAAEALRALASAGAGVRRRLVGVPGLVAGVVRLVGALTARLASHG